MFENRVHFIETEEGEEIAEIRKTMSKRQMMLKKQPHKKGAKYWNDDSPRARK